MARTLARDREVTVHVRIEVYEFHTQSIRNTPGGGRGRGAEPKSWRCFTSPSLCFM